MAVCVADSYQVGLCGEPSSTGRSLHLFVDHVGKLFEWLVESRELGLAVLLVLWFVLLCLLQLLLAVPHLDHATLFDGHKRVRERSVLKANVAVVLSIRILGDLPLSNIGVAAIGLDWNHPDLDGSL